jgi:hypothetical protein
MRRRKFVSPSFRSSIYNVLEWREAVRFLFRNPINVDR